MGDASRGMDTGSCFVGESAEAVGADVVGMYAEAEMKDSASGLKKGWSAEMCELCTSSTGILF